MNRWGTNHIHIITSSNKADILQVADCEREVGLSHGDRPSLCTHLLQPDCSQFLRSWYLASRLLRRGPHDKRQGLLLAVVSKVLLPPPTMDLPLSLEQHLCAGV